MALAAERPLASGQPSAMKFFETALSYQKTAALKAGIELDVFTAIAERASNPAQIAQKTGAAERGIRILCDYLTIHGLLTKEHGRYGLTADSELFLNRKSQAYLGDCIQFLTNPKSRLAFDCLTESVRRGGCSLEEDSVSYENPVWIEFARSMMAMMYPMAQGTAAILPLPSDRDSKVLDIAASHGIFGISIAKRHPRAHIVALDWPGVLELTKENAKKFGVADRFSTIAGDAFAVDFGHEYDAILLPNFLHHFDPAKCEEMLAKCKQALRPGGSVAIVEFVPNDDRISPPASAAFSMTMLAQTAAGDAYTLAEFHRMLSASGFETPEAYPLLPTEHLLIVAKRK